MRLLLTLLAVLAPCVHAAPELNIGSMYEYLEGTRSTALKRIYNSGDGTAFVKVTVAELVYGADGKVQEVSMDGLPTEQRTLIASPARLIVPAKGMQQVRLLFRGERTQERYFRLRFIPVLPDKQDSFGLTAEETRQYGESLKAGVNILAGYGAVVFVKPTQTRYDSDVVQEPGRFAIPNRGNATVVLDHFNDCDSSGRDCTTPVKHHIRPGGQMVFDKKPGRAYRFVLEEGEKRRSIEFNG
ncbi:pilus assembly protein [Pseudomonas coleopterorum]|jgi:hypothetical protein|uniref:pilus assembly protein n=1 Tax=Pseudomonas coleopterorum TaxID=1605838 RepID=UPI0008996530|nr:pilus assembly protein [Pseudomonas coleopterorum]SED86535.1 hypothetical protein SAMN05216510_0651 [Pseudomonas coleopterorum]